jgi:hypothetical protein
MKTYTSAVSHKVRKQFILDDTKIKLVKESLGVKTDTEAVSMAMDIVLGDLQIWQVLRSLRGKVELQDVYGRQRHV